MPFNASRDCSLQKQLQIGLIAADVISPRSCDRTSRGTHGVGQMGSLVVQVAYTKEQSKEIYDMIKPEVMLAPTDSQARCIILLGKNSCNAVPNSCIARLGPDEKEPSPLRFFAYPGGHKIEGLERSQKFIAFVWANQDQNFRVHWPAMTGYEQDEWIKSWVRCGHTHERRQEQTRGLIGTNISVLTAVEITAAVVYSPTLRERIPNDHQVPAGDRPAPRPAAVRALDFMNL